MALETPIVFCIYNRPEPTLRVFEAIRQQRPQELFIVADGPKANSPEDLSRVALTRDILRRVDWNCRLQTLMSDVNLGCRARMASGLTWAFAQAERLIVLEDDCLPTRSFFSFCESMLEHYQESDQVSMISGNRFVPESFSEGQAYLSRWNHIWGWASWRRAWDRFDVNIPSWPKVRDHERFAGWVENETEYKHWAHIFDQLAEGHIDTWDFSLMYALWMDRQLTVIPPKNLVSNIGFGVGATHTVDANSHLACLPAYELEGFGPPVSNQRHQAADRWTYENLFAPTMAPEQVPDARVKRKWWRPWKKKMTA